MNLQSFSNKNYHFYLLSYQLDTKISTKMRLLITKLSTFLKNDEKKGTFNLVTVFFKNHQINFLYINIL